jgi:hypothetical protein
VTAAELDPAQTDDRRPTAGQLALREAARLEAAKVYGGLVPEHHNQPSGLTALVAEAELRAHAVDNTSAAVDGAA